MAAVRLKGRDDGLGIERTWSLISTGGDAMLNGYEKSLPTAVNPRNAVVTSGAVVGRR